MSSQTCDHNEWTIQCLYLKSYLWEGICLSCGVVTIITCWLSFNETRRAGKFSHATLTYCGASAIRTAFNLVQRKALPYLSEHTCIKVVYRAEARLWLALSCIPGTYTWSLSTNYWTLTESVITSKWTVNIARASIIVRCTLKSSWTLNHSWLSTVYTLILTSTWKGTFTIWTSDHILATNG